MAVTSRTPETSVQPQTAASLGDAPLRPAAAVAVSSALAIALPAYLVADVENVGRSSAWIVTLGVMVWAGLRLSGLVIHGQPRLFDFFFWLFVYIFLGIAPTVQIRLDQPSTSTPGVEAIHDLPTAGLVVLGLVTYDLGRLVAGSRARKAPPPTSTVPQGHEQQVSEWRAVALTSVAALVTAYFLVKIGPGALLGSRESAQAARTAAWPDPAVRSIVYASAVYPLVIGAGALAQLRSTGSSLAWRRTGWVGLLLCMAILLVVVNPVATARYTFGTVIFALAVYLGAVRTSRRVRTTMLGTLGGFLFIFPLVDVFRSTDGGEFAQRSSFFGEYAANPDYDAFWQLANSYLFWLEGFVEPLRQLFGSLLFWVPRAVWPGKPMDTGILLAQYRGYKFGNLSAPLWAEAMVNGGVVGLVVTFVILGYALFRMDSKLTHALTASGVWAIAGAVFPVYMTILLRGSLLQATGVLIVATVCVLFVGGSRSPVPTAHSRYNDSS